MKKVLFTILLIFVLAGCSKPVENVVENVVVENTEVFDNFEDYCSDGVCVTRQYLGDDLLGATSTSATNGGDNSIVSLGPTVNHGSATTMDIYRNNGTSDTNRVLIKFTLPAGSGTITDVKLNLYQSTLYNITDVDIHSMIQAWTEAGSTWNTYDGSNNWATAGGGAGTDYNATIIDTVTLTSGAHYNEWVAMGTGSTNPLTLTWEDTVDFMVKINTESGTALGMASHSGENAANKPYIEITYTPDPVEASNIEPLMFGVTD